MTLYRSTGKNKQDFIPITAIKQKNKIMLTPVDKTSQKKFFEPANKKAAIPPPI